jgi:hypothetical protein
MSAYRTQLRDERSVALRCTVQWSLWHVNAIAM